MKDHDTNLEDFTLKQISCLTKRYKLKAIEILIDSITEDKLYDEKAKIETEVESKRTIEERMPNKLCLDCSNVNCREGNSNEPCNNSSHDDWMGDNIY